MNFQESKKPAPEPKSGELRKYRYARRSNLEIAEEIEEEAVESSDDDGQIDEGKRVIDVRIFLRRFLVFPAGKSNNRIF